jgi:hypothetical protein
MQEKNETVKYVYIDVLYKGMSKPQANLVE